MVIDISDLVANANSILWGTGQSHVLCLQDQQYHHRTADTVNVQVACFQRSQRDTLGQQERNVQRELDRRVFSISIHLVIHSANILIVPACHLLRDCRSKQEGCGLIPHTDHRPERQLLMEVFIKDLAVSGGKEQWGWQTGRLTLGVET